MSTFSGVVLAACSMVLTGGYLVVYKRYFTDYPSMLYLGLVEGAALCWYVALAWGLGREVTTFVPPGLDITTTGLLLGVVVATVGAAVTSIQALKRGEVSYVAPLSKLAPPVVLGLELLVLDVRLSGFQIVGLVVVTAGVYILNRDDAGLLSPFVEVARRRPAQLALASAALIGAADVGKRIVLSQLAVPPQTLVVVTLAGLTVGTLPFGLRRWDARPRTLRAWGGLAAVALVLAAADHLTALALTAAPASVVVPILSGQAVVAVVLGGNLLDEDAVRRRTVATLLTAVGIALIAVT